MRLTFKVIMLSLHVRVVIACFIFIFLKRVSPKTLLTFCTNGVLLRTLMAGDSTLSTVTHVIVVRILPSLSYTTQIA